MFQDLPSVGPGDLFPAPLCALCVCGWPWIKPTSSGYSSQAVTATSSRCWPSRCHTGGPEPGKFHRAPGGRGSLVRSGKGEKAAGNLWKFELLRLFFPAKVIGCCRKNQLEMDLYDGSMNGMWNKQQPLQVAATGVPAKTNSLCEDRRPLQPWPSTVCWLLAVE